LQTDFDRLDRHSSQLAEQLAEVSKQKKAAILKESDHSTAPSSHTGSSVSGKKGNASSEYRDAIHQLEVKIEALKEDNVRLDKENQRLKNSMQVATYHKRNINIYYHQIYCQVAEQRVKSSLYDQMLLHHQIQSMEEDLLMAKASITRLTREVEDRKFARHNRDEKDKKATELQREIVKLQHEVTVHKESLVTTAKLQSDLSNAEKVNNYATQLNIN